jgi:hypothetical protein
MLLTDSAPYLRLLPAACQQKRRRNGAAPALFTVRCLACSLGHRRWGTWRDPERRPGLFEKGGKSTLKLAPSGTTRI